MTALPPDFAALTVIVAVATTLGVSMPRPRVLRAAPVVALFVLTSAFLLAACSVNSLPWGGGLMVLAALPLLFVSLGRHRKAGRMPLKLALQESVVPVWPFGTLLVAVHLNPHASVGFLATFLCLMLGSLVGAWLQSRYEWARKHRAGWDEVEMDLEFANVWTAIAPVGVACLLALGTFFGSAAVVTGTDHGTVAEPATLSVLAAACAVTALSLWATYRYEGSRQQPAGAARHRLTRTRTRTRWPASVCATVGLLAACALLMSRAAAAHGAPTAWIGVAAGIIAVLWTADSLIENSSTLQLTRPDGGTLLVAGAAALTCGAAWCWLLTDGLWASGTTPYRVLSALLVTSGCLALTTYVPYLTARIIDRGRASPRLTENSPTMNIGQDALHLSLFMSVAFVAPYWLLANTRGARTTDFYNWLLTPTALLTVLLFTLKNNHAHLKEQKEHNRLRPARLADLLGEDEAEVRRRFMSRLTVRIWAQEALFGALTVASFAGTVAAYFSGSTHSSGGG